MHYGIGDKFLLCGIECTVGFIDSEKEAHLFPEVDGEDYNNTKTVVGCAFAIVNSKGKDKLGNRVEVVTRKECGAV